MGNRIKSALAWTKKGPILKGQREYIKFLKGERITMNQAISAACYRCTDGWDLEKGCHVPDCPLILYCPYNEDRIKRKLNLTDEQKKIKVEQLKRGRQAKQAA